MTIKFDDQCSTAGPTDTIQLFSSPNEKNKIGDKYFGSSLSSGQRVTIDSRRWPPGAINIDNTNSVYVVFKSVSNPASMQLTSDMLWGYRIEARATVNAQAFSWLPNLTKRTAWLVGAMACNLVVVRPEFKLYVLFHLTYLKKSSFLNNYQTCWRCCSDSNLWIRY